MKKVFRTCVTLLFVLCLFSALSVAAFADSAVSYKANRQFEISPDAELFDGFKNIMPGDVRKETITIRNEFVGSQYVYIYLQAVPHSAEAGPHMSEVAAKESYQSMMDFLAQMTLTVTLNGKPISQDTADKPAGLSTRQLVGVFRGRGQSVIEATVTVPITMGNEYADRLGEIDWVFTAEEWNLARDPRTGDDNNMLLWLGISLVSVTAASWLIIFRRKKKTQQT